MSKDTALIRDQLGTDPEVFQVLNANYTETIGIEELNTTVSKKTLGHVWIVGSPTNSIVGTWTGTEDGQQLVVGSGTDATDGRVNTIYFIVNPNQIYNEHFKDTDFKDTSTTAYWDTTNYRLSMTSSTNKMKIYNTMGLFKSIAYNDGTITRCVLNCTETKWGNDIIKYYGRTATTNSWEELTLNLKHTFVNTGTNLQLMIIFLGNGANDTYIENVNCDYS